MVAILVNLGKKRDLKCVSLYNNIKQNSRLVLIYIYRKCQQ